MTQSLLHYLIFYLFFRTTTQSIIIPSETSTDVGSTIILSSFHIRLDSLSCSIRPNQKEIVENATEAFFRNELDVTFGAADRGGFQELDLFVSNVTFSERDSGLRASKIDSVFYFRGWAYFRFTPSPNSTQILSVFEEGYRSRGIEFIASVRKEASKMNESACFHSLVYNKDNFGLKSVEEQENEQEAVDVKTNDRSKTIISKEEPAMKNSTTGLTSTQAPSDTYLTYQSDTFWSSHLARVAILLGIIACFLIIILTSCYIIKRWKSRSIPDDENKNDNSSETEAEMNQNESKKNYVLCLCIRTKKQNEDSIQNENRPPPYKHDTSDKKSRLSSRRFKLFHTKQDGEKSHQSTKHEVEAITRSYKSVDSTSYASRTSHETNSKFPEMIEISSKRKNLAVPYALSLSDVHGIGHGSSVITYKTTNSESSIMEILSKRRKAVSFESKNGSKSCPEILNQKNTSKRRSYEPESNNISRRSKSSHDRNHLKSPTIVEVSSLSKRNLGLASSLEEALQMKPPTSYTSR